MPMKELIVSLIDNAIARAHRAGKLASASAPIAVDAPKDPGHGDIASNIAFTMARTEAKSPRSIAAILKEHLELPPEVEEASVAGAGFINFRMAPAYWRGELRRAAIVGEGFTRPQIGNGKAVQVEFLSANPTGPLTIGHGRNAVLGDTISRLYEATGLPGRIHPRYRAQARRATRR
jgi:arginyl-tRNA synthetase